ncbi:MAG: hypothetical protein R3D56_00660 [Paracoccaceae bacterium]
MSSAADRSAPNSLVRDELAPEIQMQIDALARDLMERFEALGVDPTPAPGQPALSSPMRASPSIP